MGQYKLSQRIKVDKLRRREQLEKLLIQQKLTPLQLLNKLSKDQTDKEIQKLLQKLDETIFYHWYNEPPRTMIEIKTKVIRKYLDQLKNKLKAKEYYDLLRNKLKIPKAKVNAYLNWLKKPIAKTSVSSLLKFCEHLKINPRQLEEDNAFTIRFPINLKSPLLVKLKTHILNEGSLSLRWETIDRYKCKYVNKDPVLHWYVIKLLKELGVENPNLPRYRQSEDDYEININATITRILRKIGVEPGHKTITNPSLDPRIFTDPELRKYHFQATLTEEGSSSLRIKDGKLIMRITWGRSIDITDKLTPQQIKTIKQLVPPPSSPNKRREIAVGKLLDKIQNPNLLEYLTDLIETQQPNLFKSEIFLLSHFHGDVFKEKFSYPARINVSKEDRITLLWQTYIEKPSMLNIIINEYGFLPGTWKAERLRRQLEIYRKYGNRKLNRKEVTEVEKLIDSIPDTVPKEWMMKKYHEFFEE